MVALSILMSIATGSLLPLQAATAPGGEGAVASLSAQLDVERRLLDKDRVRYGEAAAARDAATERLDTLYDELDGLASAQDAAGDAESAGESLRRTQEEIAAVERMRAEALARCADTLGMMQQRLERIGQLEQKIAELRGILNSEGEPLSGTWDVSYLPSGDRGVFTLRQSGTLVSGRYTFDGGFEGSLRGTFIRDTVTLERIDSRLGRTSELEGYLDPESGTIRGSWQNYDLTDGSAASGFWTAVRRPD
jgi:hypothetical protein